MIDKTLLNKSMSNKQYQEYLKYLRKTKSEDDCEEQTAKEKNNE